MDFLNDGMSKDEKATAVKQALLPMGEVTSKKMFGGIGIFLEGLMFAKITGDGLLFFRVDDSNRADYEALGKGQFHSGSKKKGMPYYEVPEQVIADEDQFLAWAKTAHGVAVANKKK